MSGFQFSHGGYRRASSPPILESILESIDVAGGFDYMFPDVARDAGSLLPTNNPQAVTAALTALAEAMIEDQDTAVGNSGIPPVYTYWGQFIDHDITLTNRDGLGAGNDILDDGFTPFSPDELVEKLANRRRAIFDLDSIYGDGPGENTEAGELGFYVEGVRLKIGSAQNIGDVPNLSLGLDRDLPRKDKTAVIGDGRNDENTIIAQFHLGWMRFHNAVVDWVEKTERKDGLELFLRAQSLVRRTYQWMVVHDYLKAMTMYGTVDRILYGGNRFYDPGDTPGVPMMPMEFATAVYRFGHSMVRSEYDFNMNFGRDNDGNGSGRASFAQLFQFTAGGDFGGFGLDTLPSNWIIDWDRLTNHGSQFEDRFARRIDTKMSFELANMTNEEDSARPPFQNQILLHLARRNLLRGYQLSIPTGQALARAMGIEPLTAAEIQSGNSDAVNSALADGGFIDNTPLWYYILKEAEVHANGTSLGRLGSEIIAETIIGLMRADAGSAIRTDWTPEMGVKFDDDTPVTTIRDVFRFAGVM